MTSTPPHMPANQRLSRSAKMFRVLFALMLIGGGNILPAQRTQLTSSAVNPSLPAVPPATLTISTGDLVTVDVFNTPELSGKYRVGQAGTVDLPQGGAVQVAGLTPAEAAKAIEKRLKDSLIMTDPHVTILVTEYASQGVIVLGEVRTPGTYTLLGEHSLYGALAAAGGATPTAGDSIVVTHQGDPNRQENIRVSSPNFSNVQRLTRISPGDTVFVSRAEVVYVLGDVGRSGIVNMANGVPLNVLKVLSIAEGPNRTAKLTKASIIRQTGESVVTIPVDLKKIMRNQAPDPVMQASDVLVVPRSDAKAFFDNAIPGLTAAVVSSIITALIIR